MTKRKPQGLDFPDMPQEYKYLWSWFVQIANAGDVGFQTIEAFCRLKRVDLSPTEVDLILEFDMARRRMQAEDRGK